MHNASPAITSSSSSKVHGNVHTGATPLWLMQDDDEEEEDSDVKEPDCKKMCVTGPSEEQFKQRREHVICSKLNPNRVGTNFYKEKQNMSGDSWLPSFGGVWNYGPRSKHKKVQGKSSNGVYSPKNFSSSVSGHISISSHIVKLYRRKRVN